MLSVLTIIVECIILNTIKVNSWGINIDTFAWVLIAGFTVVYVFEINHDRNLMAVKVPLLAGYFFRLFLLWFDCYCQKFYRLPNSGADSEMFFRHAIIVSEGGTTERTFLPVVMGNLFKVIGVTRVYGQFLLMLCSIVSLLLLARMLNNLRINKIEQIQTMYIIALLPNFAILSAIFMRESIVSMFVTISLYFFIKWHGDGRELWYILACAAVIGGARFHSGVISLILGFIIIRLVIDRRQERFHLSLNNIIVVLVLSFVFIYLYVNYESVLFSKMSGLDGISDIANVNTAGGSSYAQYVGDSSSIRNLVIYTLPRMFYFTFSPFPWQWRSMSDIIAFFFSSLFYIVAIIHSIKYLRSGSKKEKVLIICILILFISMDFVFSWGASNTGTAARHRDKMVAIFGLLWALSHRTNETSYELSSMN